MTDLIPTDLESYDAVGLSELVRKGRVTSEELLDITIRRVEDLDSRINAVVHECFDRARQRARDLDANRSQSPDEGPFAGIPTFLKDLVDYEGTPRTDGSVLQADNISASSPAYVQAMEAGGLIIAGKTNTPEFASMGVTDNDLFGETLNPWDLSRSSGGSSGGAAAAVAAGYTPIVHGTDGGGSNRIPASWCGVFGMKASRGRLSSGELDGSHPFFKTHQAISRSVRDSAALFAVTQNTKDNSYPQLELIDGPSKRRLRIGLSSIDLLGCEPESAIRGALDDAARLLEDLGHHVSEIDNPVNGREFFDSYLKIFLGRNRGMLAALEAQSGMAAEETGALTRCTIDMMRAGDLMPEGAVAQGEQFFAELAARMRRFYESCDVWMSPVTTMVALPSKSFDPTKAFDQQRSEQLLSNLPVANAIGSPAMAVPLYWSAEVMSKERSGKSSPSLPIGTSFMAQPGDDEVLYRLAYELELARPWRDRRPPIPSTGDSP